MFTGSHLFSIADCACPHPAGELAQVIWTLDPVLGFLPNHDGDIAQIA